MLPESTHMERMIMGAMQVVAPDVLKHCWERNSSGETDDQTSYKKFLLQELIDEKGPGAVLSLPEHIPENALSSSLLYLLLNSSSPKELMEKINRYDRYFHPTSRLTLIDSGDNYVIVENVSHDDDRPTPAEELFLCGALRSMLTRIGCVGLDVKWQAVSTHNLLQVLKGMDIRASGQEPHTRWKFVWQEHVRSGCIDGLDEFLSRYAEPFSMPNKTSLIDMVEKVLTLDLGTKPSMEVVADMLGMSVRSFQRKMREEGTTYTRLFNELRIKVASRMLRQSEATITEVGFVCGFRDSSHFSREFKKAQQVSPKRYRELFKERR